MRKAATPPSPGLAAQHATSAIEIDNETLREQVQHLQRKLSMMEDTLEDARAAAEREEAAVRERIKRFKEKEESMRNELTEGRKAVEQVAKAEALAKSRIEEVEEALRESTLALENARAEIEVLRTDVVVCRCPCPRLTADLSKTADMDPDDVSPKVAGVSRQAAMDHARLMDEIRDLKGELELSRLASRPDTKTSNTEVGDTISFFFFWGGDLLSPHRIRAGVRCSSMNKQRFNRCAWLWTNDRQSWTVSARN